MIVPHIYRSLGGTYITDVLSFKPPTYIAGIIYAAALPYMGPTLAKVGSPACLLPLVPLMHATSVEEYQTAAITFLELTHSDLPYTYYLACLGNSIIRRREVTTRLLGRTQDEAGLLKAGRETDLPLLVIHGTTDRVIIRKEVFNAIEGWRNMTVVDIDNAEHFLWISQPEKFRREVLTWIFNQTACSS